MKANFHTFESQTKASNTQERQEAEAKEKAKDKKNKDKKGGKDKKGAADAAAAEQTEGDAGEDGEPQGTPRPVVKFHDPASWVFVFLVKFHTRLTWTTHLRLTSLAKPSGSIGKSALWGSQITSNFGQNKFKRNL